MRGSGLRRPEQASGRHTDLGLFERGRHFRIESMQQAGCHYLKKFCGLSPALLVASDPRGDYGFLSLKSPAFDFSDRGVRRGTRLVDSERRNLS